MLTHREITHWFQRTMLFTLPSSIPPYPGSFMKYSCSTHCFIYFFLPGKSCLLVLSSSSFYVQMFLTVYLSNNDQHFTEVPVTPETLCRDVVELCKEPGETDCHLSEMWRGSGECLAADGKSHSPTTIKHLNVSFFS